MAIAWNADSLAARNGWQVQPSREALGQLVAIARATSGGREALRELPDAREVLPMLNAEFASAREELLRGSGVVLLRGLPLEGLSQPQIERLYWLAGGLFGEGLAQNLKGDLLGDVIDLSDVQASARPFQNGGGLIMHRDPIDIVGLLCVRHAKAGGRSRVVNALAIHDEIARERPDLLQRLYEGFVYHRLDEDRGGAEAFTPQKVPVFARDEAGQVSCFFIPGAIHRAARMGYPMDSAGREALERFVELSQREDLYFDMTLEPGDLQFLNNRLVLHGRTDYEDFPQLERRRYMLRLWLANEEWPALDARQRFFDDVDHFGRHASTR